MAKNIKLTYFDGRGRAELSRMILAAGKKSYEDKRISFEDWPKIKPTTPFGSLPVLEVGGKQFGQNLAIAIYLAKECGLYGSNSLDALMIDQVLMLKEDMLVESAKVVFEKDEETKAKGTKKLLEEVYPKIIGFFCKFIKENPAKSGFVVGKKLTAADIAIHDCTHGIVINHPGFLDKYPEVKALRTRVEQADGLKSYLAKRKETPF